jgi:hypothetical protein
MDNVIPGLFIGGITSANDDRLIKSNKITHIVSAQPATIHNDIIYHNVHVDDDERVDIYSYFYNAVEFIDDALSHGNNVLVHCYAGISRSASIVLAYLMAINKYTLSDALELLISKRRICDPNRGFVLQLKCFEWALSLMPKTYVTNEICKGPVFNGIQFDFANHEVLFCEDLESKYDGCIFIDRSLIPSFRPIITNNIIVNYSEDIYQVDILQYINPKLNNAKQILIASTDNRTLVVAYWNLLYRSGMPYDDSFKYFKTHVLPELNNAFDSVSQTILYPFITPRETIIATQLARLDALDKQCDANYLSGRLKRNVGSLHAFIDCVTHYFIPEIQERMKAISEKLDRQISMCV